MSFTPPPDYSKSILALAIGAAAGVVIFTVRTDQLAFVGDNTHRLPYGGQYRDGNKLVNYNGPHTGAPTFGNFWPAFIAILLTLIIHFRSSTRRRVCIRCSEPVSPH
ncbi:TGB2 [Garlic virus H]|nr:TGB2 [Garlic virus H]